MMSPLKILKVILFFILLPIFGPAYLLMQFGFKWWTGLLGD